MAVAELFTADRATTTVSSGGTTAPAGGTQETWTVASSLMFGAASTGVSQFHVADPAAPSEVIAVTNVSGTTWAVTRGAESTTPVSHAAGFTIYQVVTSGFLASPVFSGAVSTGGLTGATAASRYAGATASAAPVSGTFAVGDFVIDQAGKVWICTAAGTPGTWTAAGPTIPVTISQGGTGQATQQAAIDALAGAVTSGQVLRGNGTHVQLAALQAGDIPQLADYAPTGLTGATAASRYGGATAGGAPQSGTWLTGDWVADPVQGVIWICTAGGTPGTWRKTGQAQSVFDITTYGAAGDGQVLTDGAMLSASAVLTTGGLAAPSAPSLATSTSGGTVLAGTYQVKLTLVNAWGETTASTSASIVTTGATSTVTVTTPQMPDGNVTGYYVYCTQAGGSTWTRQQAPGQPVQIGLNWTLTAPPSSGGAQPPGSNTTASLPFTAGDVGKVIQVKGAGAANVTTLATTIASYQSPGQVTLTAANASGGNVTGCLVMWATDDTTAINAASAAAQAYAAAHGAARLYTPAAPKGLYYGIGGALQTANYTNAQIPLAPAPVTGPAPVLEISGDACGTTTHWLQASPQVQGSTWVSFGIFGSQSAQGNSINAFGDPCVLGGPSWNGYGGLVAGNVLQSNMHVRIRDLNILTAHSAFGWTYGACNLLGVAKCSTDNFSYSTTGLFLNSFSNGDFNSPGTFGNGYSKGFITPGNGNNDCNDHRNLTCYGGYTWGLLATEHFDGHGVRILYCANGLAPVGSYAGALSVTGVGATHKIRWSVMSIESCPNLVYIFGTGSAGIGPFLEGTIDTEAGAPAFTDSGGNGMKFALGRVTLTGLYTVGTLSVPATGLEVINGQQAPGPAGTISLTPGTAQQLGAYRWATVTMYGGTSLTTVSVGATMGGASAPSMTTQFSQAAGALPPVTVRVPPGGWLEVAGTGSPAAPTANVVYD